MDDALASWAVPKGPSYDPEVKRLAVQTEDHPLEYGSFEGRIPDGEYGAGDSLIWDRGVYETMPPGQASQQRKKGHLHLVFSGEKLQGGWHLVRTRGPAGTKSNLDPLQGARTSSPTGAATSSSEAPGSVVSGRATTRGPERRGRQSVHAAPEKLLEHVFPPMLATLTDAPPEHDADWLYELKYDGYRAHHRGVGRARGDVDAQPARSDRALPAHRGGVVARRRRRRGHRRRDLSRSTTRGGRAFSCCRRAIPSRCCSRSTCCGSTGRTCAARPLEERRDLLTSVMSNLGPPLRVAERVEGPGKRRWRASRAEGLEGSSPSGAARPTSARAAATGSSSRRNRSQEVAIIGYTPSEARTTAARRAPHRRRQGRRARFRRQGGHRLFDEACAPSCSGRWPRIPSAYRRWRACRGCATRPG